MDDVIEALTKELGIEIYDDFYIDRGNGIDPSTTYRFCKDGLYQITNGKKQQVNNIIPLLQTKKYTILAKPNCLHYYEIDELRDKLDSILDDYAKIKNVDATTLKGWVRTLQDYSWDDGMQYGYFSEEGYNQLIDEYVDKYRRRNNL